MKPATTRDAFASSLSDSGLLSGDDLHAALAALPPDGADAARELVSAGKLTRFQADAVLHRRFDELRIGNYEVLDLLGKGGMGTVFKARHRRMKRVVALKVLSREVVAGQGSFVQRFQREVETIAQLTHPNIVMAFDADEAEVGHFLVMEFVDGRDLANEVQHAGPLSVADAVSVVLQAAAGLEYAHARGIVHRDIKPANLLRTAEGVVKVADLGLARLAGTGEAAGLTQAGGIVGTTEFMPPEQALDSTSIDHRADVYSLACTLYFLLTGRPPFSGGSFMAVLLKHRESPVPSLRDHRPEVPHLLDAVFAKAMAKKPEQRYQNMTELIRALEGARAAGLPDARPAPPRSAPVLDAATIAADSAGALMTRPSIVSVSFEIAGPTPSEVGRVADLAVVVVEPSRVQAGIIRRYLQQLGIDKVHAIGSGKQALELARTTGAGAMLCAMHLSDMTGVQLAQLLRAEADLSAVGFVLTTSETDSDAAAVLRAATNTVLLAKPFDLRGLAQALAAATGRKTVGQG